MNIGVVTVYNSENCGSFLQAYALNKLLQDKGHNVIFYYRDTKSTTHDPRKVCFQTAKLLLKGRCSLAKLRIISYNAFNEAQKHLQVLNHDDFMKIVDIVIIGSDTMWNFADPYFWKMRRTFCGLTFCDKRVITYAVSIANTDVRTIINDQILRTGISKLSNVSVRDAATADFVEKIKRNRPPIVLDPTLMVDAKCYATLEANIPEDDYLLIYCFKSLNDDTRNYVELFAKQKHLKIVTFGTLMGWEDIYEPLNPMRFLAYFNRSKYVITDTFHGNIFSIIYKKRFVSFGTSKLKIISLLQSLGLDNRLCYNPKDISSLLSNEPNYEASFERLYKLREDSTAYLDKSLYLRGEK